MRWTDEDGYKHLNMGTYPSLIENAAMVYSKEIRNGKWRIAKMSLNNLEELKVSKNNKCFIHFYKISTGKRGWKDSKLIEDTLEILGSVDSFNSEKNESKWTQNCSFMFELVIPSTQRIMIKANL